MADVSGLRSPADADAYRGVNEALGALPCGHSELISSQRPSDYMGNLERAAAHHDLVIAGSFLLTDAVVAAAHATPGRHFVLVDPIVPPAPMANLLVLTFRRDQSAFLAGALAAMLTKTNIVAGVYGPGGPDDQVERDGFAAGALFERQGITVLGAYQPADAGEPYNDPAWGAIQARAFSTQQADVIFGSGASTGVGALNGAAASGRSCIAAELPPGVPRPSCLVATTHLWLDRGVAGAVREVRDGWRSGTLAVGVRDDAISLDLSITLSADLQQRLHAIAQRLAEGTLSTAV